MLLIYLWTLSHTPLMAPHAPATRPAHRAIQPTTPRPKATSQPTQPSTRPRQPLAPIANNHSLSLAPKKIYTLHHHQFYRIQQSAFGKGTKVFRQHNITYKVQRVPHAQPGHTSLQMRFARIQFHFRANKLREDYDSRKTKTKAPTQAHILAAFLGHHFTVTLHPNGQVQQVAFSKALHKALQRATRTHPVYAMLRGAQRAAMAKQIGLQYGPAQWQREMTTLWSYLPPQTIPAHHQWRRRSQSPLYGMTQDATWTLTKRTKTQLHIKVKASLLQPRDGVTPFDIGSTKHMSYDIKGSTKGTMVLDAKTRLPLSGRVHVRLNGQIKWLPPSHTKPRRIWPMMFHHITQWQP